MRVVVGLSAMGLVAVFAYLAIVNEPWASSALARYLTYNRTEALFYVAEWLLVLGVPLVGAVLVAWKTTHPQAVSEQRFGQLMWMLAFGIAIGLVVMFWGTNWLFLGAMVMIIFGGYAGSSGHRGVTRAVGLALGFAGLAVLPLYGFLIALGCSMQGSCGWSGTEIVANWVGPLLVAASLVGAAISLLFLSAPSKKQMQPTPSPPIPQR
jgi:hypothetical protein